jgi:dipeptidyl-peptidase-3
MRQGVGMLLAELMRIKAEGDYDGAKALIGKYGIHFDTAWRGPVVARCKQFDLPAYWSGVNLDLKPVFGKNGKISEVEILYPRNIIRQQLR